MHLILSLDLCSSSFSFTVTMSGLFSTYIAMRALPSLVSFSLCVPLCHQLQSEDTWINSLLDSSIRGSDLLDRQDHCHPSDHISIKEYSAFLTNTVPSSHGITFSKDKPLIICLEESTSVITKSLFKKKPPFSSWKHFSVEYVKNCEERYILSYL